MSQALDVGVRALPILSLITFFIGLILALQAAYELRRFGAISYVATAVAISMSTRTRPADYGDCRNRSFRVCFCRRNRHHEGH